MKLLEKGKVYVNFKQEFFLNYKKYFYAKNIFMQKF